MACRHFSCDLEVLRRKIAANGGAKWIGKPECVTCGKSRGEVWMCLACGYAGCGRLESGHMLKHATVSGHGAAVNLKSTMIWCYVCEDEIVSDENSRSAVKPDDVRKLIMDVVNGGQKRSDRGSSFKGKSSSLLKGCRGMVNIGNSCFLAASIQCLSHVPPLSKILRHCPPYSSHELQGTVTANQRLVIALRNILLAQWGDPYGGSTSFGGGGPISPDELLTSVQRLNALFQGYHQHDAQEFLRFVLNTVHEELRVPDRKKTDREKGDCKNDEKKDSGGSGHGPSYVSVISEIFGGKTCSTITCLNCHKESKCIEEFYDLSLPIPSEPFPSEDESTKKKKKKNRVRGDSSPLVRGDVSPVASEWSEDDVSVSAPPPPMSTGSWLWSRAKSILGLNGGSSFFSSSTVSLRDCLMQFTQTEKLTGSNAYMCEHCKEKHDCLKRMSIASLPEVLVIHLKRFRHDSSWGTKLNKVVSFPVGTDFDLSAFVEPTTGPPENPAKPDPVNSDHKKKGKKHKKDKKHEEKQDKKEDHAVSEQGVIQGSMKYRLCGFVQHMGSLNGGHYIAYVRHKSTGQWLCCDDSRVTLVSDIASIENAEPYVLFFQKVADPSVVKERSLLKSSRLADAAPSVPQYLPRKWACQVLSFSSVPVLSLEGVVCPHGHPGTTCPVYAKTQFEAFSKEYVESVVSKHSSAVVEGSRFISSIQPCSICTSLVDDYNFRLSAEHKLVSKLDTKTIEKDENWYFIDSDWVGKWRQYLRHSSVADINKRIDPGPVDNAALANRLRKARSDDGKKETLKMTTDYIAVNKSVFHVFAHCHGFANVEIAGPSLDIMKASINGSCQLGDIDTTNWGLSKNEIDKIHV